MIDLMQKETMEMVVKYVESEKSRLGLNSKLFDFLEGEVSPHLHEKMKADLGEKSYEAAKDRAVPVNIFKKYVDKVSKIYQQEPRREIEGSEGQAKESDMGIVDKFVELLNFNSKMNSNNEFWNGYQYSLLQSGMNKDTPFIRTIPNHQFLIMNASLVDPTSDDIVILIMTPEKDEAGTDVPIYWVYTDEQFAIYAGDYRIRTDIMQSLEQTGELPYEGKPFSYLSASENLVMPKKQIDAFDMVLLIPLLLSDTTYIAKFTAFTQLYTIDVDAQDLSLSPNFRWDMKSDDETDKKPEVGTIKPDGDIDKLVKLSMSLLEIWLNEKGIKTGSIGTATTENAISGIAKMIDEADTTDLREKQASMYARFETEFWDYLLKVQYPFWKEQGLIEDFGTFSPNAKVKVSFAPQTPMVDRATIVEGQKKEVDAGFTTVKRAIKTVNPNMGDSAVEALMDEIEGEKEVLSFGEKQDTDET